MLHLTHDMSIGGTEQVIKQLISGLDSEQYRSSVLCLDNQVGALGLQLKAKGVSVDALNRRPGFDLKLIRELRRQLKIRKVDILHCHQYTPYTYGVLAALLMNVRVIYTEHGRFHPDRYSWKRRLVNPCLSIATDAITAISEATKQALAKFEWFPKNSIDVIYNGIAEVQLDSFDANLKSQLGIPNANCVFGTIARLDSIKNQVMMLDAFSIVHAENPKSSLLIVGDGPERANLENHSASLGIKNAVCFTGFKSEPFPYLAIIDIFLLSSLSEGTSMTLLEAMSSNTPCVVTAVGGNTELLQHRQNGLVVESDNSEKFAAAMLDLITDKVLSEQLASAARNTFKTRFALHHMITSYNQLYVAVSGNDSK